MPVFTFNPLTDSRWSEFLETHPDASVFHTTGWLHTLRASYGYEPFVLTTCPPGAALTNGIVFCCVRSWITGTRWVSVPFADHCAPLYESPDDLYTLLEWIASESKSNRVDHVGIRPLLGGKNLAEQAEFGMEKEYKLHLLDLEPTLQNILASCDRSSVQRRLKHAERENLVYEEGSSPEILKKFYSLLVPTRRRHGVPPQPLSFFRNLLAFLGPAAKIRVASHDEIPIASVLTIANQKSMIYKYGCSDERYHKHGAMVWLFWRSIREAKETGARTFDMGRSDLDNPGLIKFKSNWGTREISLTYWQYPPSLRTGLSTWLTKRDWGTRCLSHLPDSVLIALGNVLYKHAG